MDGTANVFTLSDLSSVWATFNVPAQLLGQVRVGSKVKVLAQALDSEVEGTVSYIGDLLGEQTRAATARVTLSNPEAPGARVCSFPCRWPRRPARKS